MSKVFFSFSLFLSQCQVKEFVLSNVVTVLFNWSIYLELFFLSLSILPFTCSSSLARVLSCSILTSWLNLYYFNIQRFIDEWLSFCSVLFLCCKWMICPGCDHETRYFVASFFPFLLCSFSLCVSSFSVYPMHTVVHSWHTQC